MKKFEKSIDLKESSNETDTLDRRRILRGSGRNPRLAFAPNTERGGTCAFARRGVGRSPYDCLVRESLLQLPTQIRCSAPATQRMLDQSVSQRDARNAVSTGLVSEGPGIPDAMDRTSKFNPKGLPEVALNQKVKNLIQKLGEAIHESVSESENIAGVVKNIRDQGFDVMLMLEATIGLNQVDAEAESAAAAAQEESPLSFTHNDLSFLKSLRITLPDEEPTTLRLDAPHDTPADPDASAEDI
jgi:hypothetical protein